MHKLWQDQLPFYVAGTLAPYERAAVEQHLAECDTCRAEVAMWQTAAAALWEEVNARVGTNLPVLKIITRREQMLAGKHQRLISFRQLRTVTGYGLTAAVLLLVLGLMLFSGNNQRPTDRPRQVIIVPLTTSEPSPTAEPLPASVLLTGIRYEAQGWNNDGPANLSMVLGYHGWNGDQETARQWLRPNPEDKSASPDQLIDYVNEQTPYRALYRIGGTAEVLKQLLAAGFPVIIEEGFLPAGEDWLGHYLLLIGYDETQETFLAYDSYLGNNDGEGLPQSYSFFDSNWRHFNRLFIVVYEPSQEANVLALLGDYADPKNAYRLALQIAQSEADRNPDKWAWLNLGSAYTALSDYQNAADAYDQARQQNLPWRWLWYQFGPYEAYYQTGRYEDVRALAESVLANTFYVEEAYYWLGMASLAQGDPVAAFEQFQSVFKHNPNFRLVLLKWPDQN